MRRLITGLVVLLVLLVAADRVGVAMASRQVASRIRASVSLTQDPKVDITGFPFLTQALSGQYDQVDVQLGEFTRGGVRLSRLDVSLLGARIPLTDAVHGDVMSIPVDGLTASAVVTFADVASVGRLAGIRVTPAGAGVHVTAHLTVLGQSVTASTESTVRLVGRSVVITAQKVTVLGQSSGVLNAALAGRLDLRVPIGALPYGLALTGVHASSAGLVLEARSGPTVIPVRAV